MSKPVFRRDKIRDCLDMLYGRGKYNTPGNPCWADGYYAMSLEKRFGKSIEDLKKEIGYTDG